MCLGDAKIYSSELKRKHGFIVRYVTKESICHLGPVHLKDEMAFQDEIFRPEGENLT